MDPLLLALVGAGILTQEDAERLARLLSPEAYKLWAEEEMAIAWAGALQAQQDRAMQILARNGGAYSQKEFALFWATEDVKLWASIQDAYLNMISERATVSAISLGAANDTWNFVNQGAVDWASSYYTSSTADWYGSIPNLNVTSRQRFQEAYLRWQTTGLEWNTRPGIQGLIDELTPVFGAKRAKRIAVTETTRITSEAALQAADQNDFVIGHTLLTAADERVCPTCGPLHLAFAPKREGFVHPTLGNVGYPPFHVECRCDITADTENTVGIPGLVERWIFSEELSG